MQPLRRIESVAVVLREANLDTDTIYPARFLLLTERVGLGRHLFHDRRRLPDGSENLDFPLNGASVRDAQILVGGENFGCGSSREQAVWALADHGIRVVVAPSFAEIFLANCFRNAVLPIALDEPMFAVVAEAAARGETLVVDVGAQSITLADGAALSFVLATDRREALLHGWDETGMILQRDGARIEDFETSQRSRMPWLHC